MNKRVPILLLFVVLIAGLYFLLGPGRSGSDSDAGLPSNSETVTTDTLNETRPEYSEQADLSPGMAKVEMEILKIDRESEQDLKLTVRAQKVLGYGSSTPPIGVDAEFTINAGTYYKNDPEMISSYSEGDLMTAILSHVQSPTLGDTGVKSDWTLVKVFND